MAGGRTTTTWQILLHTLVSVTVSRPPQAAGPHPEAISLYQQILEQKAVSVAELSAACGISLGVTRVLLGDLAERGLITVHSEVDPFARDVLERLIDGLRAL